jgi:hypothetical protein
MRLYHGSAFKHTELKPGFEHSGVEVNWDQTESNRFLYAQASKIETQLLGLASAIEKKYALARYQYRGKNITIEIDENKPLPTMSGIQALVVWLYEIDKRDEDGWVKSDNPHNNIHNEWKTTKTIKDAILSVNQIDIKELLSDRHVVIRHVKPGYVSWSEQK